MPPLATAPPKDQPVLNQPTSGLVNTGYSQYPPSYQETVAPGTPTEPSGFTPSTEFYVGQHVGRRGSNGHGAPMGKTIRVGNATYSGMRNDCYEGFCENCQINVSSVK